MVNHFFTMGKKLLILKMLFWKKYQDIRISGELSGEGGGFIK